MKEDIDDKLPQKYLEGFNNGYAFSKAFPDVAKSITEQNKSMDELNPVNGVLGGIEQALEEDRNLVNDRLIELKEIENPWNENIDHEIDR